MHVLSTHIVLPAPYNTLRDVGLLLLFFKILLFLSSCVTDGELVPSQIK